MAVQQLADKTGVSIGRIYQLARRFGRLPTEQEVLERKGKRGKPQKYFLQENISRGIYHYNLALYKKEIQRLKAENKNLKMANIRLTKEHFEMNRKKGKLNERLHFETHFDE